MDSVANKFPCHLQSIAETKSPMLENLMKISEVLSQIPAV
ncbi:hypothetical protein X975_01880, partial [Stegodyphus mimosarum]